MRYSFQVFLLTFLFAVPAFSNSLSIENEKIQALATAPTWLKLLSFESSLLNDKWSPAIYSDTFYLSKKPIASAQELISTLQAFKLDIDLKNANQHAQCKYPARFIWLSRQLDFNQLGIKPVQCPDYMEWSNQASLDSISFVFATGYLGNPASYYGHTLINLNTSEQSRNTLLDTSINYGADVPDDEGPVAYILKGIVGGYDGSFTHSKYYFHTQNYLENELRDLWEYKLNLSNEDQQFLLAHLWELLNHHYAYYFFNRNCVSRMYQLLSIIDEVSLPEMNPLWVVPQEVIRAINQAIYKDQPLVNKVKYTPSRQTQFYNKYWQLTANEVQLLDELIADPDKLKSLNDIPLTNQQKQRVLAVLLDYFQFVIEKNSDNEVDYNRSYDRVLAARFQLPIGKAEFEKQQPEPPHKGRPSSYSKIAYINNNMLGNGLRITIRPTYYDQLDASSGHIKNALLKMAELELKYLNSAFSVSKFTLVDITSVNNLATGLPEDGFDSWQLSFGFEEHNLSCQHCVAPILKGSKGWALPISVDSTIGFYVGGAVTESYQGKGNLYASTSSFITNSITNNWNIKLDIEARHYQRDKGEIKLGLETRYQIKTGQHIFDVRAGLNKHKTEEIFLGLGYYW